MRSARTVTCCFSSRTLTVRASSDRLQVEGAVAGLADGPGDEALGLAEDVDDA